MLKNNHFKSKSTLENGSLAIPKEKKIVIPRFDRGTVFGLDLEEMENFFREIKYSEDKNAQRDFLMFKMIFFHGLRKQEAANLKITDLSFDKSGDSKKDRIYIKAIKNGRQGRELLHPIERDLILKYLKTRKKEKSEFLFTSQNKSNPGISTSAISRAYKKFAILAKLPKEKCHVHCLRHTFAFQMIENGATLEQVMIGLRQKSLQSAMKYFAISETMRQKIQANFFSSVS